MGAKMLQRPAEPYLRQQAPEVYGALSGFMGTAPDEQGSVLDPNTAKARAGAEIGFPLGTALQLMPFFGPAKTGAMAVGRAGERFAERAVPRVMERGGMGAEMLQGMSRGTVSPLDVYHGSPHKFDKFDASKIGTGEGNQSYGHGLYLAESPGVAGSYQAKLGKYYDEMQTPSGAMPLEDAIEKYHPDGSAVAKVVTKFRKKLDVDSFNSLVDDLWMPEIRSGLEKEQWDTFRPTAGNLYKVDLPDEQIAKMLDWDKPLSEQPNAVKALRSIADKVPGLSDALQPFELGSTTGRTVNDYISRALSPEDAARLFKDAGIPGIKYLDATSRGAGTGTRNFVTFPGEEKSLTILERNNQPVQQNRINSFIQ